MRMCKRGKGASNDGKHSRLGFFWWIWPQKHYRGVKGTAQPNTESRSNWNSFDETRRGSLLLKGRGIRDRYQYTTSALHHSPLAPHIIIACLVKCSARVVKSIGWTRYVSTHTLNLCHRVVWHIRSIYICLKRDYCFPVYGKRDRSWFYAMRQVFCYFCMCDKTRGAKCLRFG